MGLLGPANHRRLRAQTRQESPRAENSQVLNGVRSYNVKPVGPAEDTHWQRLRIVKLERN